MASACAPRPPCCPDQVNQERGLPTRVHVDPSNYRSELLRGLNSADVIEFAAGIYANITLQVTRPVALVGRPGGTIFQSFDLLERAMLVTSADVVVRNITFAGAVGRNGNGAAIRHEGGALAIERCTFRRNQNSILGAHAPAATVRVRNSTFIENGAEDGHAHDLYIADSMKQLSIEDSVFFGTNTGHHLKSRAAETKLLRCIFGDGVSGSASYAVDIPNGGRALVTACTFRKSPNDRHFAFVNYGCEGQLYDDNEVILTDNTFYGRSWPSTVVLLMRQRARRLILTNNSAERAVLFHAGLHGIAF
jgi:hypothetical protein